ncbi:ELMO/CED-12 family-domain-containing protein [Syncephalis plumigaleata]|nr:ELMO/CED-12 family-domain-containing protein [Syncephalis plumigaleata]
MLSTQVELVYENREIQCLIDLSLPVADIVRNLCLDQLNLPDEPGRYALRLASTLELITDDNIRRKVSYGERIRLVVSPQAEARDMAKQLQANTTSDRKKLIFTLKEAIKEPEFAVEFCRMGGLQIIMDTVRSTTGNSLAYALNSLANLMEHDFGWDQITDDFIHMLARLVVHETLVNVSRPATAVLIKLVCADATSNGPIQCYGYAKLHQAMSTESDFLSSLVGRLSASDYVLAQLSLALVNAMSTHVTAEYSTEYQRELDRLGARKLVMRLMQLNPGEEMGKHLLDFQQIILRHQHQLKYTQLGRKPRAARITEADKKVAIEASGWTGEVKWRLLGFDTENPWKEMQRVGLLGLKHMYHYVQSDADHFAKLIIEQLNRTSRRRCPYAHASIEVTELLSDQWNIGSGYAPATAFQPLQLVMEDVHTTTLLAFFRAWNHMEATTEDFDKVSALVRSHVQYTLQESDITSLFDYERAMLETPYEVMRARQLKDLEDEDDLLTKLAFGNNLRERLYRESYEFVKQQRIECLVRGAWFPAPWACGGGGGGSSGVGGGSSGSGVLAGSATAMANAGGVNIHSTHGKSRKMTYRYYRLSPNKKYLHYGEFAEINEDRPPLEELPERIDLSLVTHVLTGSIAGRPGASGHTAHSSIGGHGASMSGGASGTATVANTSGNNSNVTSPNPQRHRHAASASAGARASMALTTGVGGSSGGGVANQRLPVYMTFSLMTGNDLSLVDFVAPDATRFAEWTDGFNMLLDRNIANRDTAELIMSLTEVVTRVHLLDVAAEKLEIPSWCDLPTQPPSDFSFYYGEIS